MRIRRRTAAALCALFLLVSAGLAGWWLLQPERLRTMLLAEIRGALGPGWDAELDGVSYELGKGRTTLEGLRLIRTVPSREVVARIPRVEAATRLWQLVANLAITDVRVTGPEILVERTADGRFPLADALAPREGGSSGPSFRPRVRVEGGSVRYRDGGILAPGGSLLLAIEQIDWQESKDGGPSELVARFRELGEGEAGSGALGPVTVRGRLPLAGQGLLVAVERFTWDGNLLARLSEETRGILRGVHVEGGFGDGADSPGLEVGIRPGDGGPSVATLLRPRSVAVLVDALPLPLSGGTGTLSYDGADGSLEVRDLLLRYEAAEIRVDGRLENLAGEFTGGLKFWARGLDLDADLHDDMPEGVRRVWDAYGLSGVVDVTGAAPGEPPSFDSFFERKAPGAPLQVGVTVGLRGGGLSFRGYVHDGVRKGFDWPVTDLSGRVRVDWTEGDATVVDLRDIEGRHGDVAVKAHGFVRDYGSDASGRSRADVGISIEARDLPLDEDVRRAAPSMEDIFRRYAPSGRASLVRVLVEQVVDVDDGAHESVALDFDGNASFRYEHLPLRIDGISGHVDYRNERVEGGRTLTVALQGVRGVPEGGGTVTIDGTVEGDESPRLGLSITGKDVPLDGPLETALRAAPGTRAAAAVWDRLRPSGPADFRAEVTGRDLPGQRREEYHADLKGVSIAGWGDIRFPVTGLTGTVEVLPDQVRLRGLRGDGSEGPVTLGGVIRNPEGDPDLDLVITAVDALLDESLRGALGHAAAVAEGYFRVVKPAPGLRGNVTVTLKGPSSTLEPSLEAADIRGGIRPMDVRNLDVADGRARYADGRVEVAGVVGAMGDREFTVREARFDLDRGIGRMDLEVRRLRFPRDLLGVLSEEAVLGIERVTPDRFFHVDRLDVGLSDGFRRIALDGVVSLSPTRPGRGDGLGLQGTFDLEGLAFQTRGVERPWTEVTGAVLLDDGELRPGIDLDGLRGRIDFGGTFGPDGNRAVLTLSEFTGRVEGRGLEGASAIVELNEEGTLLRELRGRLGKGQVGGHLLVRPPGSGYRGRFTLSGAHARDVLTPDDPKDSLQGRVSGDLEFGTPTGKVEDLKGTMRADITEGSLFRVPVFESIYRLLGQDKTPEFTGGRFEADLNGDRLRIREFDLESGVLSLHKAVGGSFLWLDGRIDLKLRPELKGGPINWPGIGWLLSAIGDVITPLVERIHTVRITGTIKNPVVEQEFLPFLGKDPQDLPRFPVPPDETRAEARPVWDF